jgi:AsmA protein
MKKVMKWLAIVAGALIVLIIAALLIIPMFIDVQKYKPEIESQVKKVTGRPFKIGGELRFSLFPWAGVSISDLRLGNAPGFKEKDFLSIKFFDVRVKLVPLLFKDIQVQRFVVDGPKVVLEKDREGRGNWQAIGKPSGTAGPKASEIRTKATGEEPDVGLPFKALTVGECAINNGSILYLDDATGGKREITNMSFRLTEVSLDKPIRLLFSALMDGGPVFLEGQVGPLGQEPGKGRIPLALTVKALKEVEMSLKGNVIDPLKSQQFDLVFRVAPFSPRKLMAAAGQPFPITTADPQALNRVAVRGNLAGNTQSFSISEGALELDESKMNFSLKAKDFSKPDLAFDLKLDKINLDQYLPPSAKEKTGREEKKAEPKETDYTALRKLALDGIIRIGSLTVKNVKVQDVRVKVSGGKGIFHMDPVTARLYEGNLSTKSSFDVTEKAPKTNVNLNAKGIQAGPMVKDLLHKDIIEGIAEAETVIAMAGDEPEIIKKTLNGKGQLLFKNGAIKGVDLAGMVRNVKAAFGFAKEAERPQTDFSELKAPFTITDGLVRTTQTSLVSPLLRVLAAGKANLVNEALDFRVEPKFVGTIKGQGDTLERSGITVPVLVSGTFSSPTFQPDLKNIFQKTLSEGVLPGLQKKKEPGTPAKETQQPAPADSLKGLLKGLIPSQ